MQIQPDMHNILNANKGNTLTDALVLGLASSIQHVMNEVARQAYEAGRKEALDAAAPVEKVQAEAVN
jgi:hypothetical protein